MVDERKIAYFSMEIAVDPEVPTYSGGLGILAGDTIRSAADLGLPMVAVTLLYRKGYFYQRIDPTGWQQEEPVEWIVEDLLAEMPERVPGILEGQALQVRAWKYEVCGVSGKTVPVYFLDTNLPENPEWIRSLTDSLYGGDLKYRLCQEAVLGIGGVRILDALGYHAIERYHMNEGHASLLALELLEREAKKAGRESVNHDDINAVRGKCIFTTHTPVPAGHDQFPLELVYQVLGHHDNFIDLKDMLCIDVFGRILGMGAKVQDFQDVKPGDLALNMTYLALNLSHYINGVAKKHGEVSSLMFAGYHIDAITNGVHGATWTSKPFRDLFDRYIAGWRQDNFSLRSSLSIPREELWQAHMEAKRQLVRYINRQANSGFDFDVLTLGFARRAATYKRGDLIFTDLERLKSICGHAGGIQIVFAGKAHPNDRGGKELIQQIFNIKNLLQKDMKIVYLENYDFALGKLITSGVDVWLNTPKPPLEASGTSGMKAALNGVPSLSILDGWWIEGHIEGVTGWSIGERGEDPKDDDRARDALSLYAKLEEVIVPAYYDRRNDFIDVMRHAIALNGSFFNTHRMLQQYVVNAYFL
ncbi:MAG TPA: alpha-glucan family phosphorylase [Syntrophorhabdaceae bacterium]|jgi:starch phosphorylase